MAVVARGNPLVVKNQAVVGARNLALKSDAGGILHAPAAYNCALYVLSERFVAGQTYTLQANITSSGRKGLAFFLNGGNIGLIAWIPMQDGTHTYKGTFTASSQQAPDGNHTLYIYCSSAGVSSQGSTAIAGTANVNWVKVEKGNTPTDWSPAPEDIEQDIDTAINESATTITTAYKSLIEQTSDQIKQMVKSLQTIADSQGETLVGISNSLNITAEDIRLVKETAKTLQDVVDGKVSMETIQQWARFDGAKLELGASNSPFKCELTTTELAFYQGANKVAWISNNELNILTAIIAKSIGCGNYTFVDEGDLGFSLI